MFRRIPAVGADHELARQAQRGGPQEDLALGGFGMAGTDARLRHSKREIGEREGHGDALAGGLFAELPQPYFHDTRVRVGEFGGMARH